MKSSKGGTKSTKNAKSGKNTQQKVQSKARMIKMPVVNEHAAGIDVGGGFHSVCPQQGEVKNFGVVTRDVHLLADYLDEHGIKTVALESTGYIWKPLFVLLQQRGFEVILVNAQHIKNVQGRKTDVIDCQWIQLLHSLGLLNASFQLDDLGEQLRSYTRHRQYLMEQRTRFINKMNTALVQMNLQLKTVLRDLTGKSGIAIIEAILANQRDPAQLAALADPRVKATQEELTEALRGMWRVEQLFQLRQCYEMYKTFTAQIAECDQEIEQLIEAEISRQEPRILEGEVKKKQSQKNDPNFDVATLFYQLTGINLSQIGGIGASTILSVFSEIGWDMSKFPSVAQFRSWLGSCPNPKVSGGKVISRRSPKKRNRAFEALKRAANTIGNSPKHELYSFFHKMNQRKGRPYAIKATANKLATIIYCMATKGEEYQYIDPEKHAQKMRQKKLNAAKKLILRNEFSLEELGLT